MAVSILDKLRGHYSVNAPLSNPSRDETEETKDSIREHLEALLNERQGILPHLDQYRAAAKKGAPYGFPDLSDFFFNPSNREHKKEALRAALEQLIQNFEPRLVNVVVEHVKEKDRKDRQQSSEHAADVLALKFRLKARLKRSEDIEFETVFGPDRSAQVKDITFGD